MLHSHFDRDRRTPQVVHNHVQEEFGRFNLFFQSLDVFLAYVHNILEYPVFLFSVLVSVSSLLQRNSVRQIEFRLIRIVSEREAP